jgi:hypothetical protein
MKLLPLLLITSALYAQPALNGLGASSYYCVDRDGDGYGTGPVALGPFTDLVIDGTLNTKATSASHTFTAADYGRVITVTGGTGFNQGWFIIISVSGGAATVMGRAYGDGPANFGTVGSTGGSWQIYGCTGPDADDLDATLHTGADALTKHGSMQAFLAYLGYTPTNIWLLDSTGSPTAGSCTPATFSACVAAPRSASPAGGSLAADDLIMVRSNFNGVINVVNGTSGNPFIIMGYPGETPWFRFSQCGTYCIDTENKSYVVVDGVQVTDALDLGGSTWDNNIFRHIYGGPWGYQGVGPSTGGSNNLIEDSVFANNYFYTEASANGPEAGLYVGCYGTGCTDWIIRRNIAYNNALDGIHWNGAATDLMFTQNISHSNGVAGISLQSGVSDSFITSNLSFNNTTYAMGFFHYKDNDSSCGTAPCGTGATTGNLIENNTFLAFNSSNNYALQIANTTPVNAFTDGPVFDMGNNTYRNNIVQNLGTSTTGKAPVIFWSTDEATAESYLATSTFSYNLTNQYDGGLGVFRVYSAGSESEYTCGNVGSVLTTGVVSNCTVADPKFVGPYTAFPVYSFTALDFRIYNTSPAFHTGTTTGAPSYDLRGRSYIGSPGPSLGAIERQLYSQGWTALGSGARIMATGSTSTACPADGYASGYCPGGTAGCAGGGTDPYPYQAHCKFQGQAWNGAFLRDKPGSEALYLAANGGHADSGDNAVYKLTLNTTSPALTRVVDPTPYASGASLPANSTAATGDGKPTARHTYGGQEYLPDQDQGVIFAGSLYSGNGTPCWDLWTLAMSGLSWTQKNPTAGTDPYNASCDAFLGGVPSSASAWDPVSQLLISTYGGGYWAYWNPATNTTTTANHGVPGTGTPSMTIDTRRHLAFEIASGYVVWKDIAGGTGSISNAPNYATTDASCSGLSSSGPGLAFHSVTDRVVGWPYNGGNSIYLLDPDTKTCTTTTFSGGPPSGQSTGGIYGRFRYSSGLDAFVLIPDSLTSGGTPMSSYILNLNASDPVDPSSGGGSTLGGKVVSGGKVTRY